jgi:iron complex outermembrane receptor protein
MKSVRTGPLTTLVLLTAWAPACLSAQELPPDTLEAIPLVPLTVTVLRTPLRTDQAPFTVTALRRDAAERARPGLGLDEALRGVAGVQVDNRFNDALGERLSIRGFGARAQFGIRGVKVVVDGIPATLPDGQTTLNHLDLASLGRIEVIRGPASALWGNGAGGVVQLETEPTPVAGFRQELETVAGSNGFLRLGSVTAGQAGGASYRVAFSRTASDGYREWNASEIYRGNAIVRYTAGVNDFRLVGHFLHYDAQNPGALTVAQIADDRKQANGNNRTQRTGEDGVHGQLGAVWRRPVGQNDLEVSAYGIVRSLTNPIPPTIIGLDRLAGGARVALHGTVGVADREIRWSVGAEAEHQRDDRQNWVNEEGARGELTLDQFETVTGLGVFAQVAAPIGARVHALGGLRYDRYRFEAEDRLIAPDNPDDSGSRSMDALSPSVGLLVEVDPRAQLYANLTTSYETPTTTELVNRPTGAGGFNPDLDPQRTRAVEVGLKGRIAQSLAYDVAVYRAEVEDALIPFEVQTAPGRQFFRNAGTARHRGAEASVSLALFDGLIGRIGYTYTDARFESYVTEEGAFDGNRVPGVAPFRFDAALSYRGRQGWFVGVDYRRVSRIPVNDANSAFSPGYQVTDLRAGLEGVNLGGVSLAPFAAITNVFDAEYNASVTVNAFGNRYFEPAPGRGFHVGARVNFGTR